MIVTCKRRISFLWIVLATLPWVAVIFKDKVMGIAFVFSMRKFVENPAALSFLLTLPWYISWIVPPVVNFVADRIWTRFGRRKPFIIASWIGTVSSMAMMPLAPNFAWLLAAYMAFCVFNDLGGPVESLKMEIVPPAQRATAAAVMAWVGQVAVLVFWVVAIGRFDEMTTLFRIPISGEQGLYWSVCIGMVVMLLLLTLGIKETNPHSALVGQRFSLRNVFGGLFSRHLWPVYILAFSVAILGTGLGAFNQLLITEQWGYTKQDQGTNIAIGGIINLFLIPCLGLLSNKVGRGNVYVGLVIAGIVVNFSMFLYYSRVLYDARPTLVEMIVFGEMLSVIGILTAMALTPFVYDFIPRNELGTYAAGSGLVNRATNILTTNLMGLFVWGYASMFLGPPGEMVRVALREDTPRTEIETLLQQAHWNDPATGQPLATPKLVSRAWYATGAKLDHGRGYEIRLRNDSSARLREQRDRLDTERGKYRARKGYALTQLRALDGPAAAQLPASEPATAPPLDGDPTAYADRLIPAAAETAAARLREAAPDGKAAALAAQARAELAGEELLASGIHGLDALLEQRATAFQAQVVTVLGDRLLAEGDQILGAARVPAFVLNIPLSHRPHPEAVEKTLDRVGRAESAVIDLRVVPTKDAVALSVSAVGDPAQMAALDGRLLEALRANAVGDLKTALPADRATQPEWGESAEAYQLDLRILEDPLDRHPSPITRVINRLMAVFTDPPSPERRLSALARNLRSPGQFEHVSADLLPGDDRGVRLTALAEPQASGAKIDGAPPAVVHRIAALANGADPAPFLALYRAAVPTGRAQRMTVAEPTLGASFAKQQYDYLIGFVAVFALQLIGLCITFLFLHLVKIGWVRRRGAEEAEAVA